MYKLKCGLKAKDDPISNVCITNVKFLKHSSRLFVYFLFNF